MLPFLMLCCLTNLADASPGAGLPDGWELQRVRGVSPPWYSVTSDGALRVEGKNAAGFAFYQLPQLLHSSEGTLTWEWRTATPLAGADLRARDQDDSPVRVMVMFSDRRMLFYSWGGGANKSGDSFESWTGASRMVWVLREVGDADGQWRLERRDPFADYAHAFGGSAPAMVAVGIVQDTDQLREAAEAEVKSLDWTETRPF
jgi:hypothetical protein